MTKRDKVLHLIPPSTTQQAGLTFNLARRDHEVCLAVAGELDLATHSSLTAAATEVLHPPVRALLLDLGEVSFCGAAGVTSLLTIRRAAADAEIRLVLTGLQPSVRHVLDLLGTSALIAIAHTRPIGLSGVDSDVGRPRHGSRRLRVGRRARAA